jgi:hypothetical protein
MHGEKSCAPAIGNMPTLSCEYFEVQKLNSLKNSIILLPKNHPDMRKILTLTSFLALSAWCLTSCNKQSDIKVVESQTGNGPGGGGSGGGSFNWTGTEPVSAKVNGVPWQATSFTFMSFAGYYTISAKADDGTSINPGIPANALPGQVFSTPSPAALSYTNQSEGLMLTGNPGKIKVITNDATTLEGYFYGDMRDPQGLKDTVVKITEGYFKVTKP